MARLETWYKQDLKRPLVVHKHTDVFNQDSKGNLIGVEVYSDGEPVVLAGSISGYCLLADGTTVPAVGANRSGNKASVLIPQTAYSVPGPITITIKNVEGDNITTLCATVGVVRQSVSGNLVNPGSVVTDWSNNINAQLQAVQTAADNVGAIVAAPFDENTVYVVGNYVTNNGNLYRITADHAAGVAWASTAKVQCTVGYELEALNKHFIANWNLIDPDAASGNETGFIPVELNIRYNIIHAQSKGRFQYGLSLYDSNKTMLYISQLVDEATDGTNYSYSCTFSESAIAYVKLKINSAPSGIDTTDFSKVYFGKGSEYIEFDDYNVINAIRKVKNDVADLADEISDLNNALGTVPSGKTVQGQITDNASDISDLKSALAFETGNEIVDDWDNEKYYKTSSTITNIDLSTKTSAAWYACTYRACSPGDIFYYTGHGTSASRSWAFLKSNGDIISRASAGDYENEKITAPANAAYVIFNINTSYPYLVIKGEILPNKLNAIQTEVDGNTTDITSIESALSVLFDNKTASGTGEMLEEFAQITDTTITDATSAAIRNVQIFEAKYPGATSQYGVNVTKNNDGTYTFDGLATSSAWFYLNQETRTGTGNVVTLKGVYSASGRVVSGSWQNVTYEGSTRGIIGVLKASDASQLAAFAIGENEEDTFEVESDTNVVIGFRLTNGVRYNNMRIEISVNKGNKLFPYVKYIAPTTISSFTNVASVVKKYTPYIWIQTTPNTANISVSGTILKSDEPDEKQDTSLYGILGKYNDRVDTLTQMFKKPLFLVYTDIHGNDTNLKRIDTWYKNNKPVYVSDVYCLGDMVKDQASDPITQFDDTTIWAKTLRVIGNHDVLASSTIPGITAVAAYEKYIAPAVSNWGVTQPTNAATDGKNYYYKDYSNKVRVIVLDTYFYTTDQHDWFVETLADAAENSLAVIVAEHEDICKASEKQPLNAEYPFARKYDGYTGLQYRTYGEGGNYETKRAAVDTFIGNGGTFICWLVGHQHADMTGTYNGGTNGKQLSVNLSNASTSMISSTRIKDYSQDCFTYLGVDTDAGYIYLLRIGESVDKWFHQNLFMVYDYVNHSVVEYH